MWGFRCRNLVIHNKFWKFGVRNFTSSEYKSKNFYALLGLNSKCTPDDVKNKYRELAQIHHPDKNNGRESELFSKYQEAYIILSDSKSRLRYDMFMNINNPDFNAAEAQKKLRDTFMTDTEKKEQEINKQKINALLYKIRNDMKSK
jgi:DnaJ-class molecular chaperone